jgi:hypothetical protein
MQLSGKLYVGLGIVPLLVTATETQRESIYKRQVVLCPPSFVGYVGERSASYVYPHCVDLLMEGEVTWVDLDSETDVEPMNVSESYSAESRNGTRTHSLSLVASASNI